MKSCPYCLKTLPFFNLVWQRLKADRDNAIVCERCSSVISQNGGANWIDGSFSCIAGGLCFHFMDLNTVPSVTIALLAGFLVLLVSSYFTAPIRKG